MNAHSDTHVIVKCKRPRKHPRASRPFANQSPTAIPSSKVFLAFVSDCNFKIHRARAPAHLHSNASSCALACLPLRVRKFCVIERRQWIHLAPASLPCVVTELLRSPPAAPCFIALQSVHVRLFCRGWWMRASWQPWQPSHAQPPRPRRQTLWPSSTWTP